jgi:hypothetical protein
MTIGDILPPRGHGESILPLRFAGIPPAIPMGIIICVSLLLEAGGALAQLDRLC